MDPLPRDDAQAFLVTHAIKRHLRIIVAATVLCALAAAGFAFLRPQSYTSSATVFISPLTGNALTVGATDSNQSITVAMQTEANLVSSAAVTERVNDSQDSTLQVATAAVSATVPTNTQLIKISYTARTPRTARDFAGAYANAYLAQRSQLAQSTQQAELDNLDQQSASIQALLTKAAADAAGPHPPPDATSRVQLYATRLASLQADIGTAKSIDTFPGSVAVPAQLPARAGVLGRSLITAGGALAGLLIGLLAAAWRERRDDRIRAEGEPAVADLPILATVPAAAHHHGQPDHSESDRDDAYRRARIGILAAAGGNAVIAVSAMSAREPGADVAVAVSRSLAAAGYRVALVDAAVDDARVAPLMGIDAGTGLSDALMAPGSDGVRSVSVDGVQVVTAGSDPHAARERYSGAAIGEVLARLRAERDFVLLASSPITTGDGLAAVVGADSVVFVATDRATTHEQIADARDLVKRLGVNSLGLLVLLGGKRRRRHRRTGHSDSIRPESEAARESADASPDDEDSAMDESSAEQDEPNETTRTERSPDGHTARAGKRGGPRPASRQSGARGR